MLYILVLYIILLLDTAKYTVLTSSYLRIYGGRDADVKKFPFAVIMEICMIKKNVSNKVKLLCGARCSATALSSKWMLTAAHCMVDDQPTQNTKVVIRYISPTGELHRRDIVQMISHPNYYSTPFDYGNDIALLKTMDVQLPFYAKLSSIDYTTLIGHEAISLGYGLTDPDIKPDLTNMTLKMMDVMIVACDMNYINPSICTVAKCSLKEFLCPGDSGGAVLHSAGVIAVHSASLGCFSENAAYKRYKYASIEVPVSPYIDWITNEVTKNSS